MDLSWLNMDTMALFLEMEYNSNFSILNGNFILCI
jgi:hypothetical protein